MGEWGSPSRHTDGIAQPRRPRRRAPQARSRTRRKSSASRRAALAVIVPLPSLRPTHRIPAPPRLQLDPRAVVQAAATASEEHGHEHVKGQAAAAAAEATGVLDQRCGSDGARGRTQQKLLFDLDVVVVGPRLPEASCSHVRRRSLCTQRTNQRLVGAQVCVDRAQSLLEREGPRYRLMPSWCSSYKTHHLRPSLTIGVNYDPVPLICDVYLLRMAFVGVVGFWIWRI
jgi:hypothetical protein